MKLPRPLLQNFAHGSQPDGLLSQETAECNFLGALKKLFYIQDLVPGCFLMRHSCGCS